MGLVLTRRERSAENLTRLVHDTPCVMDDLVTSINYILRATNNAQHSRQSRSLRFLIFVKPISLSFWPQPGFRGCLKNL